MHGSHPPPIAPDLLLQAYRLGIFPMSDARDDPDIFWVEPKRRAIIPLAGFRPSRSLAKAIRQDRYRVTLDEDFDGVIAACASPRADHAESWISQRIAASYRLLHAAGHAHSVECWDGERLVGGLYGVAFDRVFCGESMFARADNASKVALAWLVAALRRAGFTLLDCQFMTAHLATLGAIELAQADYVSLLDVARSAPPACSLAEAFGELAGRGDGVARSSPASPDAAGAGASSSPGKRILQSLTQTS